MTQLSWSLFPVLLALCCGIPLASARFSPETMTQLIQGFGYDSQSVSTAERYPYIASMRDPGASKMHLCGGALVAPAVVLTAASCIDPAAGGTAAPDVRLRAPCENCPQDRQKFHVAKTVGSHIHPSWDGRVRRGHDIALIFLDKDIPGPYLNVPGVAMPWTVVPNNHPMAFVGYYSSRGTSRKEVLQESFLPFRSRTDCLALYNNHKAKLYPHKSFICAGGSGYKICLDDVGGPLIIKGATPADDMAIGVLSGATTGSCWMSVSIPALFTSFAGLQEGLDIIKSEGPKETLPEAVSSPDPVASSPMESIMPETGDKAANPESMSAESPAEDSAVDAVEGGEATGENAEENEGEDEEAPEEENEDEELEDTVEEVPVDNAKDSSAGGSSDSSAREDDDDDAPIILPSPPAPEERDEGVNDKDSSDGGSSDSSAREDDDDDYVDEGAVNPPQPADAGNVTPPPAVRPETVTAAEKAAGFATWLTTLT